MHHRSILVSVLVLLSLLLPAVAAAAQDATPAASPVAGQPLDLAAMALVPTDIEIPGIGRWFGESKTFDQVVPGLAESAGKDEATVRETLVSADWQRQYHSTLGAPEVYGVAAPPAALLINSYVHEFGDAAGAAAAFTVLEDESGRPSLSSGATPVAGEVVPTEDIPGTRVIGDESEITRFVGIDATTGLPFDGLDLTFRRGNLLAGVTVYDYVRGGPEVAEVETFAQTYLERIEQVRVEGGPGLSTRMVRLDAPDILPGRDDYLRLGGVPAPTYNESAETAAFYATAFGDAIDVYGVFQLLPAGLQGPGDDVSYENYLARFADEAAAADYLAGSEERLVESGNYAVAAVPDAATIGDESQIFAISRQAGGLETRGFEVYARAGREVVNILLFAQPEAPLEAVEELAAAQVACLGSEELCARMSVPAALAALASPATPVAATPVAATPVAVTPEAAPAAAVQPPDLAAMVLTSGDLEALGLSGFGRESQTYWELAAGTDPVTYEGLRRQYQSRFVVAEPSDPEASQTPFQAGVSTTIDEYADAAGAAAAFALLAVDEPAGDGTPVPQAIASTRTIGDQSQVRRHELVTSDTGVPFVLLELAFQRGILVAHVRFSDYTGQEPDLATLEALGDTALAKIDAVMAGDAPGLQPRTVRLVGRDLATTFDGYGRLDGETLLGYNATAEDLADESARWGDATDGYSVIQNLTRGTEDPFDDVYINPAVFRFATPEAAAAWLREGQARLAGDATYYLDVTPVDGAPMMGDESAAFSVTIGSGENRYNGFVYFVRIGRETAEISMVRHEAQPAVPLEATVELAAAQAWCLRSAAACAPLPVPAELVGLEDVVTPIATPVVATPVPTTAAAPIAEFLWQSDGGPDFPFSGPTRAALDPQGNLWVADGYNDRFVIFAPDGTPLEAWGTPGSGEGEFNFTCQGVWYGAVDFDEAGNIYVADSGNNRVQKFGPDRAFITAWGSNDTEDGQLHCPADLAIDGQGRVYVEAGGVEGHIEVFDSDGFSLATWPELDGPVAVSADGDGNIWVADINVGVLKFSAAGDHLATWSSSGPGDAVISQPTDVAVDEQGRVFVSGRSNRILVLSPEGDLLGAWGARGFAAGQFVGPYSLVLDGMGHLSVVEDSGRVQKFRLRPPFGP